MRIHLKNALKKGMALALSALLLFSLFIEAVPVRSYAASAYSDIDTSWARNAIARWESQGALRDFTGSYFKPASSITRAEFFAIVVRAFGATQLADISRFTDVPADAWYHDIMAMAYQMQIAKGTSDTTMKPNDIITRQDALTLIAHTLALNEENPSYYLSRYYDGGNISQYARGSIAALTRAGYAVGNGGMFRPLTNMSRAEAVQLIDNIFNYIYNSEKGFDGITITGNLIVGRESVSVSNLIINGDIILTDGVGLGNVSLNNCSVNGRVVIRGGGENSVILSNTFVRDGIVVYNPNVNTRVVTTGNTRVNEMTAFSGFKLSGTGVHSLTLANDSMPNANVTLSGVVLDALNAGGRGAKIIMETGKIENMRFQGDSDGTTVTLGKDATVGYMATTTPTISVLGDGAVTDAFINAPGAVLAKAPDTYSISGNLTATIDGKVVSGSNIITYQPIVRDNYNYAISQNAAETGGKGVVMNNERARSENAVRVTQTLTTTIPLTNSGTYRYGYFIGFFIPAPAYTYTSSSYNANVVTYEKSDGETTTRRTASLTTKDGVRGLEVRVPVFKEPDTDYGRIYETLYIEWDTVTAEHLLLFSGWLDLVHLPLAETPAQVGTDETNLVRYFYNPNTNNASFTALNGASYTGSEAVRRLLLSDNPLGLDASGFQALTPEKQAETAQKILVALQNGKPKTKKQIQTILDSLAPGKNKEKGAVSAVKIAPTTATVPIGGSVSLVPTETSASGDSTELSNFTYTVDKPEVANFIIENGKLVVTGITVGSAKLTATDVADVKKKATATIKVVAAINAENIEISDDPAIEVAEGGTYQIKYTLTPSNSNDTLSWTSEDTSIATVDDNGKITGVKAGFVSIVVRTPMGINDSTRVAVVSKTPGVMVDPTSATIGIGGTVKIRAVVSPITAANRVPTWKSADSKIATVNAAGIVTGVAEGSVDGGPKVSTTVTATSAVGNTANATIIVDPSLRTIVLDSDSMAIYKLSTQKITAKILPIRATDEFPTKTPVVQPADYNDKNIDWDKVSAQYIDWAIITGEKYIALTVGENDVTITAKSAAGKARIVASLKSDPTVTAYLDVEVLTSQLKFTTSPSKSVKMNVGEDVMIAGSFTPSTISNKRVTYRLPNGSDIPTVDNIATISGTAGPIISIDVTSGKLTGLGKGKVSIVVVPLIDETLGLPLEVTVNEIALKSITFGAPVYTVYLNQPFELYPTFSPANASAAFQDLNWEPRGDTYVLVEGSKGEKPQYGKITGITPTCHDAQKMIPNPAFVDATTTPTEDPLIPAVEQVPNPAYINDTLTPTIDKMIEVPVIETIDDVPPITIYVNAGDIRGSTKVRVKDMSGSVTSLEVLLDKWVYLAGEENQNVSVLFNRASGLKPPSQVVRFTSQYPYIADIKSDRFLFAYSGGDSLRGYEPTGITATSAMGGKTDTKDILIVNPVIQPSSFNGLTDTVKIGNYLKIGTNPVNSGNKAVVTAKLPASANTNVNKSLQWIAYAAEIGYDGKLVADYDAPDNDKIVQIEPNQNNATATITALKPGWVRVVVQSAQKYMYKQTAPPTLTLDEQNASMVTYAEYTAAEYAGLPADVKEKAYYQEVLTQEEIDAGLTSDVLLDTYGRTEGNYYVYYGPYKLADATGAMSIPVILASDVAIPLVVTNKPSITDGANEFWVHVDPTDPTGITFPATETVESGNKVTLNADVLPGSAIADEIKLEVLGGGTAYVTVDSGYAPTVFGNHAEISLTGISGGTATVRVTATFTKYKVNNDHTVTATTSTITKDCAVTVTTTPVTDIILTPPAAIWTGEDFTMGVQFTPDVPTDKRLNWSFTTLPAGGSGVIDITQASNAIFNADEPGYYTLTATSVSNPSIFDVATFEVKTRPEPPDYLVVSSAVSTEVAVGLPATIIELSLRPAGAITTGFPISIDSVDTDIAIATLIQSNDPTKLRVSVIGKTVGGETGLIATIDGNFIDVKVSDAVDAEDFVIKVVETITPQTARLMVGFSSPMLFSAMATAGIEPAEAVYTTDNAASATVDDYGIITAQSEGEATITAKSKDGKKSTSVRVKGSKSSKKPSASKSLKLRSTSTVYSGNKLALVPVLDSADYDFSQLVWVSDKSAVATVDANGTVTGVSAGKAKINVSIPGTKLSATCTVTVITTAGKPVTGIKLSPATLTLEEGKNKTLSVTYTPAAPSYKGVTWLSSDPLIASVDYSGKVVAVKAGTATITAVSDDGGYTATCVVTVTAKPVKVTGVALDKETLSLNVGETFTLTEKLSPADATNTAVTWKSNNDKIASVNINGTVTAVKKGKVTITVTSADGKKTAKCTVTVT